MYLDSAANNNSTRFKVIGIEMVFVPGGSYYLGDTVAGGTGGEVQWDAGIIGQVSDEIGTMVFAATVATANAWYYNSDNGGNDVNDATAFTIGASFPKGWTDFYAMIYEITQGQYVEFSIL
jgi:hypothetical protein